MGAGRPRPRVGSCDRDRDVAFDEREALARAGNLRVVQAEGRDSDVVFGRDSDIDGLMSVAKEEVLPGCRDVRARRDIRKH